MSEEEYMGLFFCGCCGKDTRERETDRDITKVALSGYSNALCRSCLMEFEDALAEVAKRFLRSSPQVPGD